MPLPYQEYSWSFTQHAVAYVEPENLFGLLQAASLVSGREAVREFINQFLADNAILTQNIRAGRGPDAWRDYQQVLAELGLMYSTTLIPYVTLTPIGQGLLDGLVGYSEALTTQALRYQYPNGFKNAIHEERESLRLQIQGGVLVKPAILILRTLLALNDTDPTEAFLTASEIQHYLVPIIDYRSEVPTGARIVRNRRRNAGLIEHGRRRNVQDWMRFLKCTDLFGGNRREVRLRDIAISNRDRLEALVEYHSTAESFWVPAEDDASCIRWFDHFGSVAMDSQWARQEDEIDSEYENRNYLRGRDDVTEIAAEPEGRAMRYDQIGERLRRIPRAVEGPDVPEQRLRDFLPPDVAHLEAQYARSEKARALHARMVREIAEAFRHHGAEVVEDPNSVDLLVTSREREGIVEVKTVLPRNLRYRVRTGVGQLFEYQYRRKLETRSAPHLVLALSSPMRRENSLVDFLNSHLHIGLLTRSDSGEYQSYPGGENTILDILH